MYCTIDNAGSSDEAVLWILLAVVIFTEVKSWEVCIALLDKRLFPKNWTTFATKCLALKYVENWSITCHFQLLGQILVQRFTKVWLCMHNHSYKVTYQFSLWRTHWARGFLFSHSVFCSCSLGLCNRFAVCKSEPLTMLHYVSHNLKHMVIGNSTRNKCVHIWLTHPFASKQIHSAILEEVGHDHVMTTNWHSKAKECGCKLNEGLYGWSCKTKWVCMVFNKVEDVQQFKMASCDSPLCQTGNLQA